MPIPDEFKTWVAPDPTTGQQEILDTYHVEYAPEIRDDALMVATWSPGFGKKAGQIPTVTLQYDGSDINDIHVKIIPNIHWNSKMLGIAQKVKLRMTTDGDGIRSLIDKDIAQQSLSIDGWTLLSWRVTKAIDETGTDEVHHDYMTWEKEIRGTKHRVRSMYRWPIYD